MFHNQLKANCVESKDDKYLEEKYLEQKINCEMSKEDVENKQNLYKNCNCKINTNLQMQINFHSAISKILIALIFVSQIVICLIGVIYVVETMLSRQEHAVQIAQEELQVLKMQMQFVLQSTHYTKSAQHPISNSFKQRSMRTYSNNYSNSIKPFTHKFSNSSPNRYKRDADISTSKPHYDKAIVPFAPNQTINYQKNISTTLNNTKSSEKFRNKLIANLTKKKQNLRHNCNTTLLNAKMQNRKTAKDDMSGSDALHLRRNQRKRKDGEEKKNKKQRQKKKRCNQRTQLGPLIATFIGEVPEQQSTPSASIGPWIKSNQSYNFDFDFDKFYLVENNRAIEVSLNGLYMILTQIFYDGNAINHAYSILVKSEGASTPQKLSECAVASSLDGVTCHTSVITHLRKGDRLLIQQQQGNRYINLRQGLSRVQLVLLREDKALNVHGCD
ncbi:uncharacterized protein [Linepithema humile]|uniref:uncharacterized protein n=1 Tax=Linepithema humile TaxID=83485 RepID=UPI0006238453|nr:PREDICTED: uncharacterized protein LOC105673806 [Linepithema humile]XP_012225138.1 PREDICTED: uncharacterized protein LOC105673806 [Linepithema humile]